MTDPSSDNRIEPIEIAVSHLQHEMESLAKSLDRVIRRLSDVESRLTQFEQHAFAPREEQSLPEALDEKPPHY